MKKLSWLFVFLLAVLLAGCSKKAPEETLIKAYPMDSLDWLLSQTGVEIDQKVSSDGKGSLRISVSQPTTVRLFETSVPDIDNATLIYRAKLRSEDLEGKAYLEMWCHFQGKGEFFSRGLQNPITGTTNWVSEETPFFLKKGDKPDNVKLNLVINGPGTVWIDDIQLLKSVQK